MRKISYIIVILLIFCGNMPVLGQYYAGQGGRVLDANPRLGSFGINARATRIDTLVPRANLYMTGNISGGASFQGMVPYRSQYEFQGVSSSSALGNFRRDSMGLAQLGASNVQRPYVDDSRSVTALRGGRVFSGSQALGQGATPVGQSLGSLDRQSLLSNRQNISNHLSVDSAIRPLNINNPMRMRQLEAREVLARPMDATQDDSSRPGQVDSQILDETKEGAIEDPAQAKRQIEDLDYYELTETDNPLDMPGQRQVSMQPKTQQTDYHNLRRQRANAYRKSGRDLLEQGQYYQAANELSLAAIYINNDIETLELQFIANLASERYMAAAGALESLAVIGGRLPQEKELFQQKFNDASVIEEFVKELGYWYDLNSRAELLLLKAYVLYQSEQSAQAAEAMQNWPAERQMKAQELLLEALK